MPPERYTPIVPYAAAITLAILTSSAAAEAPLSFNRDVSPIISEKCFSCHGPDEKTRKADLRLDEQAGLFSSTKEGLTLVEPGNPDGSELIKRIIHSDPEERMPPVGSNLELSEKEIATLTTWIRQGAPWQGHWAFEAPVRSELPAISDPAWPRNEIDQFVLARLDSAGLKPSPEAPKETLIRRVSLDLTGLPPTPEEVDAFVADSSEDAYEKLVDRLLASPHYGERMSFPWLDAARYADTNGYQRDTKRDMWHWRDWVINAFNENMPFDQFTIEQLAGDLLPNATLQQKIATGFNRNHRINGEGGIIPEEYAVEYVVDRVDTTSTTWMGLSIGCARCHDHKFDPVSQKEFYELYAFFNQVPEEGKGREQGNDVPVVAVPTPEQEAKRAEMDGQLAALEKVLFAPDERLDALQTAWESDLSARFGAMAWKELGAASVKTVNGAELTRGEDQIFTAAGPNPDHETYEITFQADGSLRAFKLDVLTHESLPETGPGRSPNGNVVISEFEVERTPAGGAPEKLAVAAALADFAQEREDYQVSSAIDGNDATGWATGSHVRRENRTAVFVLGDGASIAPGDQVTLRIKQNTEYGQHTLGRFAIRASESDAIAGWANPELSAWHYAGPFPLDDKDNSKLIEAVLPPEQLPFDVNQELGEAKLRWQEAPDWIDGAINQFVQTGQAANYIRRTIKVHIPSMVSLSLGSNDALKLWVNGEVKHIFNGGRITAPDSERLDLFLPEGEHEILIKVVNYGGGTGFYFRRINDQGKALLAMMNTLAVPVAQRSEAVLQELRNQFRGQDPEWVSRNGEIIAMREARQQLEKSIVTTMVMEDMKEPRDTFLLKRGVYDQPDTAEKLFPSVPAKLGEMDESLPKNRLGFAQWLMAPEHPLTARVRVNHYWQMYFGKGLVKTSEDFGTQGTSPSHPELLDWLALQFIESGWDVKAMQKLIVMSATYRQSSVVTEEGRAKDPENILLARAPRFRLPAEMVRDQALKVSGLLSAKLGGPSVKPYQPDDLWSAFTFQNNDEYDTNYYEPDKGEDLYRRGLYTYWKRTIAPPHMQIFNAPGREQCSMRQEATNTPMQALLTLNDPTFIEAARHLAQRMIREGGDRAADRIRYGYKLALAHEPDAVRQQVLLGGLSDYQSHFVSRIEDAQALLAVGDTDPDASVAEAELAAYTMLASVMLNLDEIITRE
jgi:mono/diheme cytochrome c family protein